MTFSFQPALVAATLAATCLTGAETAALTTSAGAHDFTLTVGPADTVTGTGGLCLLSDLVGPFAGFSGPGALTNET